MSDYDAVFYYASGETADFPPQAADFYGLVADQLSPNGRVGDSISVPTSLPKFAAADGSIRGASDGSRGSGEESKMPVHLGKQNRVNPFSFKANL